MSQVSTTHQFAKLDKKAAAYPGQRLIRVIAKADKEGGYPNNLNESLCVSVPRLGADEVADHIDKLIPHLIVLCEEAQDAIAREWRISSGRNEITDAQLSVAAIVAHLEEEKSGGRITTEYLKEWFLEEHGVDAKRFVESLAGGQVSDATMAEKIGKLQMLFSGWAGAKYSPPIPALKVMEKFVDFVGADEDSRLARLGAKVVKLKGIKEAELSADALGF